LTLKFDVRILKNLKFREL